MKVEEHCCSAHSEAQTLQTELGSELEVEPWVGHLWITERSSHASASCDTHAPHAAARAGAAPLTPSAPTYDTSAPFELKLSHASVPLDAQSTQRPLLILRQIYP